MPIPQEVNQQACEELLHFQPKKRLARELGISVGAVQDSDCTASNASVRSKSDKNGEARRCSGLSRQFFIVNDFCRFCRSAVLQYGGL